MQTRERIRVCGNNRVNHGRKPAGLFSPEAAACVSPTLRALCMSRRSVKNSGGRPRAAAGCLAARWPKLAALLAIRPPPLQGGPAHTAGPSDRRVWLLLLPRRRRNELQYVIGTLVVPPNAVPCQRRRRLLLRKACSGAAAALLRLCSCCSLCRCCNSKLQAALQAFTNFPRSRSPHDHVAEASPQPKLKGERQRPCAWFGLWLSYPRNQRRPAPGRHRMKRRRRPAARHALMHAEGWGLAKHAAPAAATQPAAGVLQHSGDQVRVPDQSVC